MTADLVEERVADASTDPRGAAGTSASGEAAAELATRIRRFELGLYHALLVARVGVPVATLVAVGSDVATGGMRLGGVVVWAVIAAWTLATTQFAWSQLSWARKLPTIVRVEIGGYVLLVLLGLGTRAWHQLDFYVPLLFVAFFATARATRIVAVSMAAALWLAPAIAHFWPGPPLEAPPEALVPTFVVVASTIPLIVVGRTLADSLRVVTRQQELAAVLADARARLAHRSVEAAMHRQVADRIGDLARLLELDAQRFFATVSSGLAAEARAATRAIDRIVSEVGQFRHARRRGLGLVGMDEVIAHAVSSTESLGGSVVVEPMGAAPRLERPVAVMLRRFVAEAVANGRKHGTGGIRVVFGDLGRPFVVVQNDADAAPRPREDGFGMHALAVDGERLGRWYPPSFIDGVVTVRVELEAPAPHEPPIVPADERASPPLRELVSGRRGNYLDALLFSRFLAALVTCVTIQLKASQHATLLPVLTVTSILLVVWNGGLLLGRRRVSAFVAMHPRVVLVDVALILLILGAEGGMGAPWQPLSYACLVCAGLLLDVRLTLALAGAFSLALLAGYELMRVAPVDDAGTLAQSMPFDWIFNTFVFVCAAIVAGGVAWIFRRLGEAVAVHDATEELAEEAERERAVADVRAETTIDLHASLEQYVRGAMIRLDLLDEAGGGLAGTEALQLRLAEIRDELVTIRTELTTAAAS